ncbi:transglutaminase-like cysteine peptidase [Vibrio owensii]
MTTILKNAATLLVAAGDIKLLSKNIKTILYLIGEVTKREATMELILLSLLWLEQEVPVTLLKRSQKAFQSIDYKSDLELWGESEYWATPAELLDKAQGDCEDVAIAKYFLLIEQGVPMDRLRLAYQLLEDGDVHMLLEYHHAPHHTYLLDIQVNNISLATPLHFEQQILSFNNYGLWVNRQLLGDSQSQMKLWREFLERYQTSKANQEIALSKFLSIQEQ